MFTKALSGLAVSDLDAARTFYADTLGLRISEDYNLMWLRLAGGRDTLAYPQPDATPASFTVLNFEVDDIDIDIAVDALVAGGIHFERYDGFNQDDKGVLRADGPYIAWFKDPPATSSPSSRRSNGPGSRGRHGAGATPSPRSQPASTTRPMRSAQESGRPNCDEPSASSSGSSPHSPPHERADTAPGH